MKKKKKKENYRLMVTLNGPYKCTQHTIEITDVYNVNFTVMHGNQKCYMRPTGISRRPFNERSFYLTKKTTTKVT